MLNMMKPVWLNKKIFLEGCSQVKGILKDLRLHTVCEEALCPNMGECFNKRQATFIILGAICTRACRFCGVAKGKPLALDVDEPGRIVEAVKKLGLTHVVITSVTRDDLPDGGASAFAQTILSLRAIGSRISIETLIPDFNADHKSLRLLTDAAPDIIAHNIETVPSLYKEIRPNGASYERSLEVLRGLKSIAPKIALKSGLMLGLGEKRDEVFAVFDDLVKAGCMFLSIGQYLAPSVKHFPVREYLHPEVFEEYKKEALRRGFSYVKSGPYVRSSYAASEYGLAGNYIKQEESINA
ncbi:MAG: lipoyl synthase [Candidatus Omnitrophica bacterium]|nr:lipoyl synthase [Candidatus Omnitrophota bacterium]